MLQILITARKSENIRTFPIMVEIARSSKPNACKHFDFSNRKAEIDN